MATEFEHKTNRNMHLFGMPYQFNKYVDPRYDYISSSVGYKFSENIISTAPVITIIPGNPKYLPGESGSQKLSTTFSLLEAAQTQSSSSIAALQEAVTQQTGDNASNAFRYYDFQRAYVEYMQYVNVLCRTCAVFLGIDEYKDYDWQTYCWNETLDGGYKGFFDTALKSIGGQNALNTYLQNSVYTSNVVVNADKINDYYLSKAQRDAKLKQEKDKKGVAALPDIIKGSISKTAGVWDSRLANNNYVQFYIDTTSSDEDYTNTTNESAIKSMLDSGSSLLKEVAFIANSGGMDTSGLNSFVDSSISSLESYVSSVGSGGITSAMSRILSLSQNVLKGDNVIMPDVYQSSDASKSYTFTVHLRSPYGSKLSYYLDICVPLMHLLALGLPKQTTANTYGSPFIVKAYVQGVFSCNLGMVTSISVSKASNDTTRSVHGLPLDVDVAVTITDLYSDLSMSPQTSPMLFISNSSLIEYLATTCGLSLVSPNIELKYKYMANAISASFSNIPKVISEGLQEKVDDSVLDFLGLTW